MAYSVVCGTGSYLPPTVYSNDALARHYNLDTSDEWIRSRTGIRQRHFASEGQTTADLAHEAAKQALQAAHMKADAVDMIILATATPVHTFPATATIVQAMLGMTRGAAFDVQAVCSGFIYALATADNFIRSGSVRTVLVIGAETFSRILDWNDRSTCVLFGDGAGAVVLRRNDDDGNNSGRGILSTHLHSDGRYHDMLYVDGGPSSTGEVGHLRMKGKEVFRHAVNNLADVVDEALTANGLTQADVDWLVPHQANERIIDNMGKKLSLPPHKVLKTIHDHANTSAASIPLVLDRSVRDGRIKAGDLLLLEAMGGGFTWGAALVRY